MKTFLVLYNEKQSHILNDQLLNAHIDFLKSLHLDNRLSICGPFVDNKGAVLVIAAHSIIEVEKIIKQDPFIKQKYYTAYVINEFLTANEKNNWLLDRSRVYMQNYIKKMKNVIAFLSCILIPISSIACSVSIKDKIEGGRCIDVGQYQLYTQIYGKPNPVVIFDSGSGDDSTVWKYVAPEVSKFARVVLYDRAGLGKSDPKPGNDSITSKDTVGALKTLLTKANIKPPYILVGHSRGGLNMQLFAETYPHEVVGVVLVDSVSRNQTSHDPNPPKSSNYYREAISFDKSREEVKKAGKFPRVPLIVLTATKQHGDEEREILWRKWQEELTNLSSEGRQMFAWNSGHYIQKQQPELVASAIYTVIQLANLKE